MTHAQAEGQSNPIQLTKCNLKTRITSTFNQPVDSLVKDMKNAKEYAIPGSEHTKMNDKKEDPEKGNFVVIYRRPN